MASQKILILLFSINWFALNQVGCVVVQVMLHITVKHTEVAAN